MTTGHFFSEKILILNTDTSVFFRYWYWYYFSIFQIEYWYWYFSILKAYGILVLLFCTSQCSDLYHLVRISISTFFSGSQKPLEDPLYKQKIWCTGWTEINWCEAVCVHLKILFTFQYMAAFSCFIKNYNGS